MDYRSTANFMWLDTHMGGYSITKTYSSQKLFFGLLGFVELSLLIILLKKNFKFNELITGIKVKILKNILAISTRAFLKFSIF